MIPGEIYNNQININKITAIPQDHVKIIFGHHKYFEIWIFILKISIFKFLKNHCESHIKMHNMTYNIPLCD